MLRLAICDDSVEQTELIKSAVLCYFKKTEQKVDIREYNDAIVFLDELNKTDGFDILLLDICMPDVLGTDVASEIRKRKDKTEIIFITSSNEFAIDAFALKAAHYLIKPFMQEQFEEAMDRAIEHFSTMQVKNITLKLSNGGYQTVDINEIIYIESFGHVQSVYVKSGGYIEARLTLTQLFLELKELSKRQFVAPYKGYIVNQKAIVKIESDRIVLQNGKEVPIVKRSFREIRDCFFDYTFGAEGKK